MAQIRLVPRTRPPFQDRNRHTVLRKNLGRIRAKIASIATIAGARKFGTCSETSPRICLKEVAIQVRPAGKRAPAIDPPRIPQTTSRTRDFSHSICKASLLSRRILPVVGDHSERNAKPTFILNAMGDRISYGRPLRTWQRGILARGRAAKHFMGK